MKRHIGIGTLFYGLDWSNLHLFSPVSTGILRHLTVVRTSSALGQVTAKPAAPVDIEQLQEEAKKVIEQMDNIVSLIEERSQVLFCENLSKEKTQ